MDRIGHIAFCDGGARHREGCARAHRDDKKSDRDERRRAEEVKKDDRDERHKDEACDQPKDRDRQ